jgi:hypothetical protein
MNEKYVVALLANVARIKADAIASDNLLMLESDARFPVNTALHRGRAALLQVIDAQITSLTRQGGLLFLQWAP